MRHRIPETNVATLSRSCSLVSAVISSSSASMLPRMTTENILELPEILGTVQSRGWRPTAETLDRGSPGGESAASWTLRHGLGHSFGATFWLDVI